MIKLQCSCRRMLKLPDELGGQKIRCKHCQKILSVPETGTRVFSDQGAEEDDTSELLVAGSRICPGCGETYPPTIVVCIECGLNLDTGAMLYASLDEQRRPDLSEPADVEGERQRGWFGRLLSKLGLSKKD